MNMLRNKNLYFNFRKISHFFFLRCKKVREREEVFEDVVLAVKGHNSLFGSFGEFIEKEKMMFVPTLSTILTIPTILHLY